MIKKGSSYCSQLCLALAWLREEGFTCAFDLRRARGSTQNSKPAPAKMTFTHDLAEASVREGGAIIASRNATMPSGSETKERRERRREPPPPSQPPPPSRPITVIKINSDSKFNRWRGGWRDVNTAVHLQKVTRHATDLPRCFMKLCIMATESLT